MTNPIFQQKELEALTKVVNKPKGLEDKINTARRQNMENAFARIKSDHQTHDFILDLFDEAEGFVLYMGSGVYLGQRTSAQEPPFLSSEINTPEHSRLFLFATRDRNNRLFLGYMNDCIPSIIDEYIPDMNYQKILRQIGADKLIDPEKFAIAWLVLRAEVELSIVQGTNPPQNRTWEQKYHTYNNRRNYYKAPIEGDDVIEFYKGAVIRAIELGNKLETSRDYCVNDLIRLFNRDLFPTRKIPTKLHEIKRQEMHI